MAAERTESHDLFYMGVWIRNKISHDQKRHLGSLAPSSKALPRTCHAVQGPLGKKTVSHTLGSAPSPSAISVMFPSPNFRTHLRLSPAPFRLSSLVEGNSDCPFCKIAFSQYKDKIKLPFCFVFVFSFFFSILFFYHKKFARHSTGALDHFD